MFNLFPFFPSFLLTMEIFGKNIERPNIKIPFMCQWSLACHLQWENPFCLCHHKTCWTMTMYNVGMKIGIMGSSQCDHSYFFFLDVNESGPRTSSTTNPMFKGRLRDPWCKQHLSEQILLWMMHEFIHWPKPYLLLPTTCDELLSWMIKIWMKNHFISDSNCNTIYP